MTRRDRDSDEFDTGSGWKDSYSGMGGGGGGRWSRFMSRLVENPDNPAGWSLFMFRFRGIETRIHLATILFMISMLLWSIPPKHGGIFYMSLTMISLFVIVLLHEFGHCFACRRVGGEADRIVMLPFGGVALCIPPDNWRDNLITTIGGPAVNVLILAITSATLALLGAADAIIFNLINPSSIFFGLPEFKPFWLLTLLVAFHVTNIYILLFNLALLMFPFDGGRIVRALMWSKLGYRRATEIAINIGFLGAMILGIVAAIAFESVMLVLIAIFAAMSCWTERQRLRAEHDLAGGGGGGGGHDAIMSAVRKQQREDEAEQRKAEREHDRQRKDEHELDRLLSKISATGMDSLTTSEKRALARLSKQKRES